MDVAAVLTLSTEGIGHLDRPVMIVGLEGWFDAGGAATQAAETFVASDSSVVVGEIDPDPFYEFTQQRPMVRIDDAGQKNAVGMIRAANLILDPDSPAGVAVGDIAVDLNRHRSTVYREIKRNRFIDIELPQFSGDFGVTAQTYAKARRARKRKLIRLVRLDGLREAIIDRLKAGWSPEQIAGRLKHEGRVSRV